jgi:hypothetical protein
MSNYNFEESFQLEARVSDGKERRVEVRRWLHGGVTQLARGILPKVGEVGKRGPMTGEL